MRLILSIVLLLTLRTWMDSSGKHSTEAELIEIHGETVYLQKQDGRLLAISLAKLSEADRTFVAEQHTDYIFVGKVVGVADADTFTMLGASNQQLKIRLEGIDAPEGPQPFGTKSKQALVEKVFGKTVTVEWRQTDKYGRFLGHVLVNDRWINKELVDEGWAWHYKEYNDSAVLADAESQAREAGVGLWRDTNPTPPWVYRHPRPQPRAPPVARSVPINSLTNPAPTAPARSTPTTNDETVYVTNTGSKYHRAGCRHLRKSSVPMPLSDAAKSYGPCSVCHPPILSGSATDESQSIATLAPPRSSTAPSALPPSGYVNRNPYGESVTGHTATGIPTFTGPRGGRYHYSKSGKKVYEKKK